MKPSMSQRQTTSPEPAQHTTRRHLIVGWTGLLVFLALGITLGSLHAFKTGYSLDTRNSTRRLMWTLAHSHGTLFSLVNIAFALSLARVAPLEKRCLVWASGGLLGALLLMPLGFFLGGLNFYGGDPGQGILLVPMGALCLLVGVGAFLAGLLRNRARLPS